MAFHNRAAILKTVASMLQLIGQGDDYGQSLTIDRIDTILASGVQNSELKNTFCWCPFLARELVSETFWFYQLPLQIIVVFLLMLSTY
jgi:hypothetical protein